jgi:hypothetical protein
MVSMSMVEHFIRAALLFWMLVFSPEACPKSCKIPTSHSEVNIRCSRPKEYHHVICIMGELMLDGV